MTAAAAVASIGGRKFALGILYLVFVSSISYMAVSSGVTGWDAAGVASLFASAATGLGVIVWGNVQEHRAKNGN